MATLTSSLIFRNVIILGMIAASVSAQVSSQLSCPTGWSLYRDSCYKLYTWLSSWQAALDVCRIEGAYLTRIEDIYANDHLGNIVSASSITNFWIGLNRIEVPVTNITYTKWSDGTPSSIYNAFWEELQPNVSTGDCIYVSQVQNNFRWALSTCEWKRAFVCQLPACPSGNFHCSTAECIQSNRFCDGTQDCSDGSDEIDCPLRCMQYVQDSSGTLLSVNYPSQYPSNTNCQWTIEGPLGSNIFLQVNSLDTETDVDVVIIMEGGKTASSSYVLKRLSGNSTSPSVFRSFNNYMIVRFYSDGATQKTGFNLTWSAEQTGIPPEGKIETAAADMEQHFELPIRTTPYLASQETVWIIRTQLSRAILTLQRLTLDLAPGDYINVRDGNDASAPLLANYTASSGPLHVFSTGPQLYIMMKTGRSEKMTKNGFRFGYIAQCTAYLDEDSGEIFSPGYGVVNYANYVNCTYYISAVNKITLRFDAKYDIDYQNDYLQAYIGSDSSGNAMHDVGRETFYGPNAPNPIPAVDGKIFVRFQTNAIENRFGWRATYSVSCPSPIFNVDTILNPSNFRNDYGDTLNVSCKMGYVFNALEFYTKQQDGSFTSLETVTMNCLYGGIWNVQRYPLCVRAYCGKAPAIDNGYVQSSTGPVWGSRANYTCVEGYTASGPTTISCLSNGTWETPPVCSASTCPNISISIDNGSFQRHEEGLTLLTFTCSHGYVIAGAPIVHCNSSGAWSHPLPTCQKVQCQVPTVTNGNVQASSQAFVDFNTILNVRCNMPAYQLVGNDTIVCLHNKSFSPLPVCQEVDLCASIPCPQHSECISIGGSVTCPCLPGFQQNGSSCIDGNECSDNNGGCSDLCRNTVGSYVCNCSDGFTLYNQNGTMGFFIPSSENGLRFGDTYYINHTCVRNQCPRPDPVVNGYLTERREYYHFGDSVTIRCKPRYNLTGEAKLLCQSNGTWSAPFPTCIIAKCPADELPKDLINPPVSISPPGEVEIGAVVNISCSVPGRGSFSKTKICRFDPVKQQYRLHGANDSYECGVVDCGQPLLPPGGKANPQPKNTTYGSTFNFSCEDMYHLQGSNNLGTTIITCAGDSSWTFFNIICIPRQCPSPGVPPGGRVISHGNGFSYLSNVTFSCLRAGFEPEFQTSTCGLSADGQSLTWGTPAPPPACVDKKGPSFSGCPSGPVSVTRYSSAGFSVPEAQDNSGIVPVVTVSPEFFHPSLPVANDMTVNYTAMDHALQTNVCMVQIIVRDTTPPSIQCPEARVFTLNESNIGYHLFDLAAVKANITYDANNVVDLSFSPPGPLNYSYEDVGSVYTITAIAKDASQNTATCQFQIVLRAHTCEPRTISSSNTAKDCVNQSNGGYNCSFTCKSGYYFHEAFPEESFSTVCEPGQPFEPSYIPSCVRSAHVEYNMVASLSYTPNPSANLPPTCQQAYNSSLMQTLRQQQLFKQICPSQLNITGIIYNEGSLQFKYNVVSSQVLDVEFSLRFESQDTQQNQTENQQCADLLKAEFEKLQSNSGELLTLRTLTTSACPSFEAKLNSTKIEQNCASNLKRRLLGGTVVCLPCPPGSNMAATGACLLCPVGHYWVEARVPIYGQCVACATGYSTAHEGSIGPQSCIVQCGGNLVSSTGVPPCSECTGNSFRVNSTYCQECPIDRLALSSGQSSPPCQMPENCSCASKCQPGFYSLTGYQPNCLMCPVGFFSNTTAATSCYECPAGQTTQSFGNTSCMADAVSVKCQPNPCENNGNCSVPLHEAYCRCQPGFTGRHCAQNIDFCISSPCHNNGTCRSNMSGFYCSCLPGFTGNQCEEDIDDCTANACSQQGTCIDGINNFTCSCTDLWCNPSNGCDIFPCGVNSTCQATFDYHRVCDCFPGYTGSLCNTEIDECHSQPCLNGGTCSDKVNGFECHCHASFIGRNCENPARDCNSANCGTSEDCFDDPVTGLPLCICQPDYSQGRICQYSLNTHRNVSIGAILMVNQSTQTSELCRSQCDDRGDPCQAFVFEDVLKTCTLYSIVEDSVPVDNLTVFSVKSCFYPTDNYFHTEWFNTNFSNLQLESYASIQAFGMNICENTDPVGIECRVATTMGAIPSGVECKIDGLVCTPGRNIPANETCPDMEVRYICARSRVFLNKPCVHQDMCKENTCVNSTCIIEPRNPKGFRCYNCLSGFTGDRCQLTINECDSSPCRNDGTCIDGHQSYTCTCPSGISGTSCEINPNDCSSNPCNFANSLNCTDGLNNYTCNCKPGFTGKNCSDNIDDCASNPCFHSGTCVDQVDSFRCDCLSGWIGLFCETALDLCSSLHPCSNGATCVPLFNDFFCRCPAGSFGKRCDQNTNYYQCQYNNPCVNSRDCGLNGTQALCYCQDGTTGYGCQVYPAASCDGVQCQNGATCSIGPSGPQCNCLPGFMGEVCENNEDECASTTCRSPASCVDGINQAFCRCPVGREAPDCVSEMKFYGPDITEDYDICFSPSRIPSGAAVPYAFSVSNLQGFTFLVWVRYDHSEGAGTFFTVYKMHSSSITDERTEILRLDENGLNVSIFGAPQLLRFELFPINNSLWHLVIIFWNSASGDLELTVDYLRQSRIRRYGQRQTFSANLWLVLGGVEDSTGASDPFQGCVHGVNMLSRGLDFTSDLPNVQSQPHSYQGDLFRWAEFDVYDNGQIVHPSTARLQNCVTFPTQPACVISSRDSSAPLVLYCPEDILVETIYSEAYATWSVPRFSDAVSFSSNHQPGELFPLGATSVVYTAQDPAGNTAVCSFTVFVGNTNCSDLDAPRGGGHQVCHQQSDDFDACSASCPTNTTKLVEDVPVYYTCGPSGLWRTLQDQGGIYPTCGRRVGPARATVSLHMIYTITVESCPSIAKGIITQGQADLTTTFQRWGGDICHSANCADVMPSVDCSIPTNTVVDIQLTNVSALMDNGLIQRNVKDVWLSAVLDSDIFSFKFIPGIEFKPHSFSVKVTYICEVGQVPRGQDCVECGPGTYYNASSLHCDNCPVGYYMPNYAAQACLPCPQGQTTPRIGSVQASICSEICPRGQFYNYNGCSLCPRAFYQNKTGQFKCEPCPVGYLTPNEGSISEASCVEGCQSGYQLLGNGSCEPCAAGTYRQYGIQQVCLPCPSAYTTPTVTSISADNCTVLRCPEGSKANASLTGCERCPRGQYQQLPNQQYCNFCTVGFTTAQTGSANASDCQQFCPSGYQLTSSGQCKPCPVATYKDNSVDSLSQCLPCRAGYITAGNASTSLSDCSIRNCTAGFFIQSDSQGVETCAPCPLDYFSSLPYQRNCTPCPSGMATQTIGADSGALCEVFCGSGQEKVSGSCLPCPQGYYKNNTDGKLAQCSICPSQYITTGNGSASISDCSVSNCSAGFMLMSNNTCMDCPLSTYQPDKWQTACIPCPPQRLTEITGATSVSQCLLSCSSGQEDRNGQCEDCHVGFYKNRTGAAKCDQCREGFRTQGNGSQNVADCNIVACPPGQFRNASANSCVFCSYNEYQPQQWQDSCLSCSSGLVTFTLGATNESQCLRDCLVGTELNLSTSLCDPCSIGYYRDKSSSAQTKCVLCPSHYITASPGAVSSLDCNVANCTAPGYFLDTLQNQCAMCLRGTYNSVWWAENCSTCPTGFTTNATGTATADSCFRDCPSGQQVNENSKVCSPCPLGTYRNRTQTWTCQPCSDPFTTSSQGSTSQADCNIVNCIPGTYYEASQNQCVPCPRGTYQSRPGKFTCNNCPDYKVTHNQGTSSVDDCVLACDTDLNTCSSDRQCSLNSTGGIVCSCRRYYQDVGGNCTYVCDIPEPYCKNGGVCRDDRSPPCVCQTKYSGDRCELRSDPNAQVKDTDVIVGVVIGVIIFILLMILIAVGFIVRRKRQDQQSSKDSMSTSSGPSHMPSFVITRTNTQKYASADPSISNGYDPAFYSTQEQDMADTSNLAFSNSIYYK